MVKNVAKVTPWEVEGKVDYDKLIKEFGVKKLTKSDLNLLYILKSDLKFLNIGCVGLNPDSNFQETLNALNLDRVLRVFKKINKIDIENYLSFAKEDEDGIIQKYLSNFEFSTIIDDNKNNKDKDNSFIMKILSKFRD